MAHIYNFSGRAIILRDGLPVARIAAVCSATTRRETDAFAKQVVAALNIAEGVREALERYNDAEGSISAYDTLDEIANILGMDV